MDHDTWFFGRKVEAYLCGKSHATRDEQTTAGDAGRHHAELALFDKLDQIADLLLQLRILLVLGGIGVGRLAAGVGVGKGHFGLCG